MSLGLRPTSLPRGILIHPLIWPQQIWPGQKLAAPSPFGGGELGPDLTQKSVGGRGETFKRGDAPGVARWLESIAAAAVRRHYARPVLAVISSPDGARLRRLPPPSPGRLHAINGRVFGHLLTSRTAVAMTFRPTEFRLP